MTAAALPPAAVASGADATPPWGDIGWSELALRAGTLGGAAVFLAEGLGWPWQRGVWALLTGATWGVLLGVLLVFRWRVLGDWRLVRTAVCQALVVAPIIVLFAGLLAPDFSRSALPGPMVAVIEGTSTTVEWVRPFSPILMVLQPLLFVVIFVAGTLTLALADWLGRAPLGLIVLGVAAGVGFFLGPSPETALGLALMATGLWLQWDRPLIVPHVILASLSAVQIEFLRALVRAGRLSTGETRLRLGNDPRLFEPLVECQLVAYDPLAREVIPGPTIDRDETSRMVMAVYDGGVSLFWLLVGVAYLFIPDLIPGPIDDIVIMGICSLVGLRGFFNPATARGLRTFLRR